MEKKLKNKFLFIISVFFPLVSFAQVTLGTGGSAPSTFKAIICNVVKLCLDFIPYIIVIAIGAFIQGLIKYVGNGDNEEKKTEGTKMMVYGILGFFFIVSIWGILSIFTNSFNLPLGIPQFKDSGAGGGCSGITS